MRVFYIYDHFPIELYPIFCIRRSKGRLPLRRKSHLRFFISLSTFPSIFIHTFSLFQFKVTQVFRGANLVGMSDFLLMHVLSPCLEKKKLKSPKDRKLKGRQSSSDSIRVRRNMTSSLIKKDERRFIYFCNTSLVIQTFDLLLVIISTIKDQIKKKSKEKKRKLKSI